MASNPVIWLLPDGDWLMAVFGMGWNPIDYFLRRFQIGSLNFLSFETLREVDFQ